MTRSILPLLAIGLVSLAPSGCSKTDPAPKSAELKAIDASDSSAAVKTEVSKEQAEAFAMQLASATSSGNSGAAAEVILSDRILDRVVAGLQLTGKEATDFRRGMASNNPIKNTLVQLAAAVAAGGSYDLVRTAVRGDEMHAVFRLLDKNHSLNYHDFRLVLDGGKAKADRIFVAATGEAFADTLISIAGPTIRSQQSLTGRMSGEAAQKLKDLEQQSQMMLAARAGDAAKAMQIYDALPAELKDMKSVQLARVIAAQAQPEKQYMAAMADYANRFPNDPSLALMSFDRSVLKEDVAGVKKCMAALDKWTGGDDYLRLLSASVVSQWGAFDYAKELYMSADPAKVGTAIAHDYKLSSALRCKDYAVVVRELRILRTEYQLDFDLEAQPDFSEFIKSPEYSEWKSE